jgi:hypothetical protein
MVTIGHRVRIIAAIHRSRIGYVLGTNGHFVRVLLVKTAAEHAFDLARQRDLTHAEAGTQEWAHDIHEGVKFDASWTELEIVR